MTGLQACFLVESESASDHEGRIDAVRNDRITSCLARGNYDEKVEEAYKAAETSEVRNRVYGRQMLR